ncbi:MAG: NAD(P)(+) transhydrogenase (Re/Si-specific) subunit beta [Actinobacteria bacterium]|jgi:NAD(P) transhydrogenase subunit beta|nr:NAD(P)(+) transhydrogenase (Re/Si-specific) subunit beta [Actinomycetota bacterium]MBT3688218.1 NAD(P)(+) transhydrogenase (Re/Si-specific) subunit beta [Actinomycetota bacterium]MBT4036524.1 NAD(P)(+) transhydrogenase (Re/Si-specific) subunit beta [Actinomycetota bacterium]MBT4278987.1 NAD(P)(+) transhydrogenase (Re/Si-specific) subunit beta [Actinomycetota bacterium]MBT4344408.1 NAD(P)(+) transhydrogenase (Re/Si-specific) subunit beta [Actinomycetota bacterium]
MTTPDIISVGYLIAAVLFILGLKGLGRPRTAPRGNLMGASGMLLAVLVTMLDQAIISYLALAVALVIGSIVGALLAVKVKMTSMPELVALFNGFGGGASVLVAIASFIEAVELGRADNQLAIAAAATALIGAVTFTGSVIAFFKLQESLKWSGFTGLPLVRVVVLIVSLVLVVMVAVEPGTRAWLWALVAAGLVLGVISTVAIGGADMPVVIALLNAFSGVAASTTGFVLDNPLLIIAGSLVGASGLILTQIMCKAMNRSIFEVIFSETPAAAAGGRDDSDVYGDRVTSTSAEEVAMLLEVADRVVIVPGYGLAVAQAQHAVRDLMTSLEASGKEVMFGIHPVAGRMPGHMNVLLAEAEIGYEHLLDMDQINPTFSETDVTIVIGANDVVNPAARNDPSSPIAGMPILDVDESRTVVVIKRSLSPGFAGIANPLFAADNALMLFGDGKQAVIDIAAALVTV